MDVKTRVDAKNVTQELTDLVSQLSNGTRTPKEAQRWFSKVDARLSEIEKRPTEDQELVEYLSRARVLASKAKQFIEKKMKDLDALQAPVVNSYEPLATLLVCDTNLSVVKAFGIVAKATSAEKLGKAILRLFMDNKQEFRLMRGCVESEVLAATSSQGTLFRRNSINSVCLASYARLVANDYLKWALLPTFNKISHGSEEYEIDPAKIAGGVVPAKNLINVVARVEELLKHIVTGVNEMPKELGYVCHALVSTVEKTMPEARNTAIGGFLMLRFFLPALASPENAGLEGPPADRRRGLMIVSKVLINLSNEVEMGKKEAFMAPLDPLLAGSRQKLAKFYSLIVETFQDDLADSTEVPSKVEIVGDSLVTVHAFLEEPHVMNEMDDAITKYADLGLDQHTPLKLRSAVSKCPPLPPKITAASRASADDGPGPSPSHSPKSSPSIVRHRAAPAPPLGTPSFHSSSASDLTRSGDGPQRRWSSSRSASAAVISETHDESAKGGNKLLSPPSRSSGGRKLSDGSEKSGSGTSVKTPQTPEIEKKSPRLFQNVQRLLKKEPDHDDGYVSTIFSESYDP